MYLKCLKANHIVKKPPFLPLVCTLHGSAVSCRFTLKPSHLYTQIYSFICFRSRSSQSGPSSPVAEESITKTCQSWSLKLCKKLPRKFRINRASHKSQKKQSHIWPTPPKKNKIKMTHQENNASKICRPMLVIYKILHHPSNKTIYLIPLCKTYLVLT